MLGIHFIEVKFVSHTIARTDLKAHVTQIIRTPSNIIIICRLYGQGFPHFHQGGTWYVLIFQMH